MSKEILIPHKVDPFRFADNAIRLEGSLLIKEMPRLCLNLSQDEGEVRVNIEFGIDESNICFMRGHFSTHLTLQCQRCLELFGHEITGQFSLAIAHSAGEAESFPKGYDIIIAQENMLVLPDVIEDELIISLPIVPMHHSQDCKVKLPIEATTAQSTEFDKKNPFKVIELLRTKRDINK